MKHFLKYLFPVIVCVAFWGYGDKEATDICGIPSDTYELTEQSNRSSIGSQESEFCLPRPVSFANNQRVQSGIRRSNSIQRNNFEFSKAGKIVNAGVRYFVQVNTIIIHSSHMEPSYRLLYLGKLII